jgi:DNA-binding NarL/FixJ family response regulator
MYQICPYSTFLKKTAMHSIAIADDQDLIRKLVVQIIRDQYNLLFEAGSAESLLRFLKANPIGRHPNLILLDISMEGMTGIEALSPIKEINPDIKVIMLTSFDDDDKVFAAIQNGADGYCIKDEMQNRLLQCLEDVVDGGSYMSPGIARKAMHYMQAHYIPSKVQEKNPLSTRETEVLTFVIQGETAGDIAEKLFVSTTTVKTHIYNVYKKLRVTNKMEAANLVRSKGWI